MTTYAELLERMTALVDDLDDLAFAQLREAVADGATSRPPSDKELAKARRAVEKAASIMRRLSDEP